MNLKVSEVMTKDRLITAPLGTTLEKAMKILQKYKIEKLLIVDKDFSLRGLITIKDIEKKIKYPNACRTSSVGSERARQSVSVIIPIAYQNCSRPAPISSWWTRRTVILRE
jgi:IMP dehydrogenase